MENEFTLIKQKLSQSSSFCFYSKRKQNKTKKITACSVVQFISSSKMLDKLPTELRTNILSRLPVDSLLRCRCVAKSYRAEIDDPNFIKTHLERSLETDSNLGMIFQRINPDSLCYVSLDSPDRVVELNYPSKMDDFLDEENVRTLGSCNGLLCLINEKGRLALINPSTRKFQTLPFLPYEHKTKKGDLETWTYGFGYDPIADDYKVVRLAQFVGLRSRYFANETMVYNLKSNSWREIEGMPYVKGTDLKLGALLGDSLHWLADRNRVLPAPRLIVAFNLGTEKFTEVPGPELLGGDEEPCFVGLGNVGKCLLLCAMYAYGTKLDFWVMKEYGVKESWTKVVSNFTPNGSLQYVTRTIFSNNGDEFLMGTVGKYFVWYDLKEKTTKHREMPADVGTPVSAGFFHGSLVPLNDNTKKATSKKPGSRGKKKDKRKELDSCVRASS